jgi:hypothetical protein
MLRQEYISQGKGQVAGVRLSIEGALQWPVKPRIAADCRAISGECSSNRKGGSALPNLLFSLRV